MHSEESYTIHVVDNGYVVDYKDGVYRHKSKVFASMCDALSFIANSIKRPPLKNQLTVVLRDEGGNDG